MDGETLDIRMRLRGSRQVQTEAAKTAGAIKGVGTAAGTAGAQAGLAAKTGIARFSAGLTRLQSTGLKMKSVGRSMTYGLTLPLAGAGFMAIKTAATFEKSMAQVGIATRLSGKGLEEMRKLAVRTGQDTVFSATESAAAMLELSKAGMSAAQIRAGALVATMDLAAAGGQDLATSAVQIGGAMNTFAIRANRARLIADALAGGANKSSADLSDLALSLQQAGQQATASDLSIFDTVGALAAFADQGIRGSDAGTAFKVFLQRLNPYTAKAREQMSKLGLSFFDAHGNMKGITEVAGLLQSRLSGLTQQERLMALQVMFGSDATRAANMLYRMGAKDLNQYIRATMNHGEAQAMAQAQMRGLPGALEELRGSLETAGLSAAVAATPAIIGLAGGIELLADTFTMLPPQTQTVIVAFAGLLAIGGPLIWLLGSLASTAGTVGIAMIRLASLPLAGTLIGGLAKALPVAAAAAGLGNIVISATEGDWKQAGFKAGGAVLGGIAGFMLGGPVGAMVGVGAGSLLGGWLSGMFDSSGLSGLQKKIKDQAGQAAHSIAAYQKSLRHLSGTQGRAERAERSHATAVRQANFASRAQAKTLAHVGAQSLPAYRAALRVAAANRQVAKTALQVKRANQLQGFALKLYRRDSLRLVATEKARIPALRQQLAAIRGRMRVEGETTPLLRRAVNVQERLRGITDTLTKTYAEAESLGGAPWAKRLHSLSLLQARYGPEAESSSPH